MKKTFLLLLLILSFYVFVGNISSKVIIPDEAIRIRVIANSNDRYDQDVKSEVKNVLNDNLYTLLNKSNNINDARKQINANLDNINLIIKDTLDKFKPNMKYNVNFGLNYFPKKEYKGVIYNEGYYESLVVTIGNGKGDNWWCVLFPPLCLIEAEESTKVEYKSYVKELIDKYF